MSKLQMTDPMDYDIFDRPISDRIDELEREKRDAIRKNAKLAEDASEYELTKAQSKVLKDVLEFAHSTNRSTFVLAGLAGTGKTTTTIAIIRELYLQGFNPLVAAPTGKASAVLNKKLIAAGLSPVATTIHSALSRNPNSEVDALLRKTDELDSKRAAGDFTDEDAAKEKALYDRIARLIDRNQSRLEFEPKPPQEILAKYDLMLFDECSMIGREKHYNDLIGHFPMKVVYIGDNAQLPPVNDDPLITFEHKDAYLTQILRQKSDSGILDFAYSAFSRKLLTRHELEKYSDITVIPDIGINTIRGYETTHQFLAHKNGERYAINRMVRIARGYDPNNMFPQPGEPIVLDTNKIPLKLFKGQAFTVVDVSTSFNPKLRVNAWSNNPYKATMVAQDETGALREFPVSLTDIHPTSYPMVSGDSDLDKKCRAQAYRGSIVIMYGYCLTVHKSQGSEFDKVFLYSTVNPGGMDDWSKWWYTAITRAKNELVVASFHFAHE